MGVVGVGGAGEFGDPGGVCGGGGVREVGGAALDGVVEFGAW